MKADSLKMQFRKVMLELAGVKEALGDDVKKAHMIMAQAEYSAGNFKPKLLEANHRATVALSLSQKNVAGVRLPVFEEVDVADVQNESQNLGLAGGGKALAAARKVWTDLVSKLVRLASLQTSFLAIDEALKVTSRRVNALEYVVLPRIEATIAHIKVCRSFPYFSSLLTLFPSLSLSRPLFFLLLSFSPPLFLSLLLSTSPKIMYGIMGEERVAFEFDSWFESYLSDNLLY